MNNANCPKDDGPDFLPGHGPYSGDSDVGHNNVAPGSLSADEPEIVGGLPLSAL